MQAIPMHPPRCAKHCHSSSSYSLNVLLVHLQHVQPKMTAHPGQHLKQEAKPSDTIGYALPLILA